MSDHDNLPAVIENPDWFASETEMGAFRVDRDKSANLIEEYKASGRRDLLDVSVWYKPFMRPVEARAEEVRMQLGVIDAEDFPCFDKEWDDISDEEIRRYLDSEINNGPAQLIYECIEEVSTNFNGTTLDVLDATVENACKIIAKKLKQLGGKIQPAEIIEIAQGLETSYFTLIKENGIKVKQGALSRIGGASRIAETIHVYYRRKD
ncbi:MAG: hypothetical protein UT33_C0012G0002 [Candidatus Peregrinibacteria bacterium GW2011_GWC2_39_14]|nr:MAG: hypothetical protein US92_C0003G0029 [Candidatus Peregrinibacteria bacterium GW2011_GWA2_38_36]KKR05197.1 MAG: hypothetical protein UT33_C0012G0002 [Candidatus Peregrinibacteria bacterium GW2011_GWC2_39_14]